MGEHYPVNFKLGVVAVQVLISPVEIIVFLMVIMPISQSVKMAVAPVVILAVAITV
jgi:hypothetical protein